MIKNNLVKYLGVCVCLIPSCSNEYAFSISNRGNESCLILNTSGDQKEKLRKVLERVGKDCKSNAPAWLVESDSGRYSDYQLVILVNSEKSDAFSLLNEYPFSIERIDGNGEIEYVSLESYFCSEEKKTMLNLIPSWNYESSYKPTESGEER